MKHEYLSQDEVISKLVVVDISLSSELSENTWAGKELKDVIQFLRWQLEYEKPKEEEEKERDKKIEEILKGEYELGVQVFRQSEQDIDFFGYRKRISIKNSDLRYEKHGPAVLRIDFFDNGKSSMQPHRELNGYGWVEIGISSKDEKEFLSNLGKVLKDFSSWRVPPLEIRLFNAPENLIPIVQEMIELSSLARKI